MAIVVGANPFTRTPENQSPVCRSIEVPSVGPDDLHPIAAEPAPIAARFKWSLSDPAPERLADMPETRLVEIEGEIKWFDPRKGYGFIIGPEGQDIFVHFSVIEQDEGFRTFRDGEQIVYDAVDGEKGWSATRARALQPKRAHTGAESSPSGETRTIEVD
jgi:CspA family cold shock protein